MENIICCGIKRDKKRCTYKCQKGMNYCKIHMKVRKVKIKKKKGTNIIQGIVRGFLIRNNIKKRGIAVYCRHLCNNNTDCFSYDKIEDIKRESFISYKDENNYWGFDIETLENLVKSDMGNPYTLLEIPNEIKEKLKLEKKEACLEKSVEKSVEKSIDLWCTEVFQKMDALNNYTKCEWFLDLQIRELKIFSYVN